MTASILQQLLALYFAFIYRWQHSSGEKSLVGKKNSSIYLKDFTDLDFFFFSFFSFFFVFFDNYLFTLSVTQIVCCSRSGQPFCRLRDTWRQCFWAIFENSNSTLNIFQETQGFLVLTFVTRVTSIIPPQSY